MACWVRRALVLSFLFSCAGAAADGAASSTYAAGHLRLTSYMPRRMSMRRRRWWRPAARASPSRGRICSCSPLALVRGQRTVYRRLLIVVFFPELDHWSVL